MGNEQASLPSGNSEFVPGSMGPPIDSNDPMSKGLLAASVDDFCSRHSTALGYYDVLYYQRYAECAQDFITPGGHDVSVQPKSSTEACFSSSLINTLFVYWSARNTTAGLTWKYAETVKSILNMLKQKGSGKFVLVVHLEDDWRKSSLSLLKQGMKPEDVSRYTSVVSQMKLA
ncbi:hypothetical protein 3 [Beihai picorna-like virus 120]|uniref:hypothetical protein 3 n=1 Tax=Beihai picorna-like virus 120 TaxID=1922549 RepID=UPI00090BB607|nr:hypothetical protein 3 [Beihai picorna-like virus 120]APG76875.1 hypothetical protein 3 [Beihai picorna-like virus 120]